LRVPARQDKFRIVEPSCHRCGALISADAAYCSACGAPQVRVPGAVVASPQQSSAAGTLASAEDVLARAPENQLNWRHAWPTAGTAALSMAVASMLPIVSTFFPLWMLGGGWLAVSMYRRRMAMLLVPANLGAKIGALAGFLGFIFFTLLTTGFLTIETVLLHHGDEIRSMLRGALDQAAAANHDPRAQAFAQWMQTPEGLVVVVAISLFLFLFAFLLLSSAGGIFAASFTRRRMPR
jgi:RNA polymerase subunit RPABC4/transcription elongation factor Spt4